MAASFFLALLATVVLGADFTISNANFTQETNTATSSSVFDARPSSSMLSLPTTFTSEDEAPTVASNQFNATIPTLTTAIFNAKSETAGALHTKAEVTTAIATTSTSHSTAIATTSTTASFTISTTESASRNAVTEHSSDVAEALPQPPSSDSLTKGFSIPTFLPEYPAFAAKSESVSASPTANAVSPLSEQLPQQERQQQQEQDQLFLAAFKKHQALKSNHSIHLTNITVQLGSHAYLPCHIRRFMNKPISWVRLQDGHILTVDQTTFIADQRFQSIFKGESQYTWSLQIKYVQAVDEGFYECQVSTEPKMSAKVYLSVVVPRTELIGDQNRFVKAGSKVALHCIVRGTLEPPSYIIWFRGKTQITDDYAVGWHTQIDRNIFGNSGDQQNTIGSLIIPFVRKKDSGNYICQPSNSAAVSVDLHVLSGEYSASAIMSATPNLKKPNICYVILVLLLPILQKA